MRDVGIVQGSAQQAIPLVVGKNRVDVHTDIAPILNDGTRKIVSGTFQYHEIQYGKDEYIRLMSERNSEIALQLTDAQVALVELYEKIEVV